MTIRELIHWNRPLGVSIRKNAWNSLTSLQDEMNSIFDRLYAGANVYLTDWDGLASKTPAVNIAENEKSFTVEAELAGIDPKDVEVEATTGFLTIRGTQKEQHEEEKREKEQTYIRKEMSEGYFLRTLALPETADCDKADASFKNGILTITIPKKPEALQKPKKLQIKKAA